MTIHPGTGPDKVEFAVCAVIFKILLLSIFVFLDPLCLSLTNAPLHVKWFVVALIVITSSYATKFIVGWYKDYVMWPRAGDHPDWPNRSLRDWWREQGFASPLSGHLGFLERIVFVLLGLVSFEAFFIACGGFLTLKTAIEWQQFDGIKYRVISHIYLMASLLSLVFAAVDVVIIRKMLNLPSLIQRKMTSNFCGNRGRSRIEGRSVSFAIDASSNVGTSYRDRVYSNYR